MDGMVLPDKLGGIATEVQKAAGNLMELINIARRLFDQACTRRENMRPQSHGVHRASTVSLRVVFSIFLLMTGAKTTHDLWSVEQPTQTSGGYSFVGKGEGPMPSPDDDLEDIMRRLETDKMNEEFLKTHTSSYMPAFPFQFVWNYPRPPATVLREKQRCCSDAANWNGERIARQGKKSYTVSMGPHHPVWFFWDPHHQVQVQCINKGKRYKIYDNDGYYYENGTLEECMAKKHPTMRIYPAGGVLPWKRTSNTIIGGFAKHVRFNVDEMDMEEYPELDVVPAAPGFMVMNKGNSYGPSWNAKDIVIANKIPPQTVPAPEFPVHRQEPPAIFSLRQAGHSFATAKAGS